MIMRMGLKWMNPKYRNVKTRTLLPKFKKLFVFMGGDKMIIVDPNVQKDILIQMVYDFYAGNERLHIENQELKSMIRIVSEKNMELLCENMELKVEVADLFSTVESQRKGLKMSLVHDWMEDF